MTFGAGVPRDGAVLSEAWRWCPAADHGTAVLGDFGRQRSWDLPGCQSQSPVPSSPTLKQGKLHCLNCQSHKSLPRISTSINDATRKPGCNSGVLPATSCDTLTSIIATIRIKVITLTTPRNPRLFTLPCRGVAVSFAEPLFLSWKQERWSHSSC